MQMPTQPLGARPAVKKGPGFDIKKALFSTPMTKKDFTTRMEIGAGIVLLGLILIIIALLI